MPPSTLQCVFVFVCVCACALETQMTLDIFDCGRRACCVDQGISDRLENLRGLSMGCLEMILILWSTEYIHFLYFQINKLMIVCYF